ncbi:hypothetical protein LguiA_001910 [Lonicera macranthoides]
MGKKDQQQQEELLKTLGDFTSKDNWDKFFSIRGTDDSFEWYADWPQLRRPLLSQLSTDEPPDSSSSSSSAAAAGEAEASSSAQILVPGCGNSRLSEHLSVFRKLRQDKELAKQNMEPSGLSTGLCQTLTIKGVSGKRKDIKPRPTFVDGTFDAVVDKGGLDALMEPEAQNSVQS